MISVRKRVRSVRSYVYVQLHMAGYISMIGCRKHITAFVQCRSCGLFSQTRWTTIFSSQTRISAEVIAVQFFSVVLEAVEHFLKAREQVWNDMDFHDWYSGNEGRSSDPFVEKNCLEGSTVALFIWEARGQCALLYASEHSRSHTQ